MIPISRKTSQLNKIPTTTVEIILYNNPCKSISEKNGSKNIYFKLLKHDRKSATSKFLFKGENAES